AVNVSAWLLKPVNQSELFDTLLAMLCGESPELTDQRQAVEPGDIEWQPLKILLTEDSVYNQKLALGVLNRDGHDLDVACNGQEAVEAVRRSKYDLVLMDVQMPVMDGLEATRQIRRRERSTGDHVPIVAMTAQALKGDRERCLEAGMDGYLAKPVRAAELRAAIREFQKPVEVTTEEVADATSAEKTPETTDTSGDTVAADSENSRVEPGSHSAGAPEQTASSDSQLSSGPASAVPSSPADEQHGLNDDVNWDQAMRAVGGDSELMKEVVQVFLEECQQRTDDLQEAARQGNLKECGRAAHTLRGALLTFGVGQTALQAEELEQRCRKGDSSQLVERSNALISSISRLLPEISSYLSVVDE
ncbi:MAG: response regulator, partial [Planctomycetaceae bacterium]|nr:response regulator [Planctomycetaceae bacterium]